MYDPVKCKAVQFSSEPTFTLSDVYRIAKRMKAIDSHEHLEMFTNEDYEKLEGVDFRTLRRGNKPRL